MRANNSAVQYRPDLGTHVMEFIEGESMSFIGTQIMPVFPTPLQSSTFPVIPKEALLSIEDVSRAPRGAYNRSDFEYERGKYDAAERGHEEPVDDGERALVDQEMPGQSDYLATERAMKILLRAQEKRIAGKIFNESNFTAHAVTTEWDTSSTATPISDVNDGISAFRTQCGMLPDALVLPWKVFQNLKECDQIVDRLKYTFPGIDINKMTSQQMAAVFNLPQVVIGGSVYNSNGRGLDASIADIWDDEYAGLVKIGAGLDLRQPCIGRTFLWTADSPTDPVVEQYREEQIRSDVFRVRHNTDERLIQSFDDSGSAVSDIAAACMYLLSNVTT